VGLSFKVASAMACFLIEASWEPTPKI